MSSELLYVLVTPDPVIEGSISELLKDEPGQLQVVHSLADLQSLLSIKQPEVVMVDLDPDARAMLEGIDHLITHHAAVRFVALSSQFSQELLLQSMHIGVRHFQMKESTATELRPVLHRLTLQGEGQDRGGRRGNIITVLSAGGGCGATTLAVNLANELQIQKSHPVLMIDLDYSYGAVANYLELSGKYGVADVLGHHGTIDSDLVASTTLDFSPNLHVLISPASINLERVPQIPEDRIEPLLNSCRRIYGSTVIDAPRLPMDLSARLARASSMVLVVMELTINDLRVARNIVQALEVRGVSRSRICVLINRYRRRFRMISIEEVQDALGGCRVVSMSNDYENTLKSINFGKPLSETAPRSALRKDLSKFATSLANGQSNGKRA